MSEKTFVAVAQLDEVPPSGKKVVEVKGISIVLCNSSGTIHAVRNLCSHAHEALDSGRVRSGWISCPVHGARFKLETGAAMNPPATKPIDVYEVRIEGETISIAV